MTQIFVLGVLCLFVVGMLVTAAETVRRGLEDLTNEGVQTAFVILLVATVMLSVAYHLGWG